MFHQLFSEIAKAAVSLPVTHSLTGILVDSAGNIVDYVTDGYDNVTIVTDSVELFERIVDACNQ